MHQQLHQQLHQDQHCHSHGGHLHKHSICKLKCKDTRARACNSYYANTAFVNAETDCEMATHMRPTKTSTNTRSKQERGPRCTSSCTSSCTKTSTAITMDGGHLHKHSICKLKCKHTRARACSSYNANTAFANAEIDCEMASHIGPMQTSTISLALS